MRHLDFTIDFETCLLSSDAAIMQVAVVPWLRDADVEPFMSKADAEPFVSYVDLRSCVVEGMDFDPKTVSWWSRQSDEAKRAVCDGLAEPVADVLVGVLDFIRSMVKEHSLDSICLWAHGMDVDLAILRSLCRRFDIDLEDIVPHTSFRDCRTLILEAAHTKHRRDIKDANKDLRGGDKIITSMMTDGQLIPCDPDKYFNRPSEAYQLFSPLPSQYDGIQHDAIYDALRSTWYTWQALKTLRQ